MNAGVPGGRTPAAPPARLWRDFLSADEAARAFSSLRSELPWRRRVSSLYGRQVPVPRREAWVAEFPYVYSGRTYDPAPWTPALWNLKAKVEIAAGCEFNSVLGNLYESGADSVGWHADAEPEMSAAHPIASLSLGAARRFLMRPATGGAAMAVELTAGSLLLMEAGMQTDWRHCLPKTRAPIGERINLTFRVMLPPTRRR